MQEENTLISLSISIIERLRQGIGNGRKREEKPCPLLTQNVFFLNLHFEYGK